MDRHNPGTLVSWVKFQRRSKTLAETFGMDLKYFHFRWEEKGRAFKIASYLLKFIHTLYYLLSKRPAYVVVQLAPSAALYPVAIYCALSRTPYLSDCHNTMIYDGHWIHWPFAKKLLKRSNLIIVHNNYVQEVADGLGLSTFVLLDPPPKIQVNPDIQEVAGVQIKEVDYVILPCNMAADDEPAEEFFAAAQRLPHTRFILTGYNEKLAPHLRQLIPSNVRYTGYLQEDEFNALYKHAKAALVLSTREGTQPSGASEAIALSVPLIVTDLEITRALYKDCVVFTKNTAQEIVEGVQEILQSRSLYATTINDARDRISLLTEEQSEKMEMFILTMLHKKDFEIAS